VKVKVVVVLESRLEVTVHSVGAWVSYWVSRSVRRASSMVVAVVVAEG